MSSGKKKKKGGGTVFTILMIACAAVVAFSAFKLITIKTNYSKAQNEYEDLRKYTTPVDSREETEEGSISESDRQEALSAETDGTKKKKKTASKDSIPKAPISVDHDALEALNPDYVGWLYIEALDISYPVMLGPDDDYYLHRTFDGSYLYAGSLFLNSTASPDLNDPHTLVYGHNMKDSSMFGTLNMLTSYNMIEDSDLFWILTKEKDYCYKICSIHICLDTSDTYTLFDGPSKQVEEFIEKMISLSSVDPGDVEYDENSKVMTLSTCLEEVGSERYVVQGIRLN